MVKQLPIEILKLGYNLCAHLDKCCMLNYKKLIGVEDILQSQFSLGCSLRSSMIKVEEIDKINKTQEDIIFDIFPKFQQILERELHMDELVPDITWELINQQAIVFFAEQWESKYGDKFRDIKNLDLYKSVDIYFSIQEIDHKDINTLGEFTYYLIKNGKLITDNFVEAQIAMEELIEHILKENKLNRFEELLKQDIKKNNKIFIDDTDLMSGREFEEFISELFRKMGYNSTITKNTGDQGVDVIVKKDGIKIAIQAKCYCGKVGNSAVQEVIGGLAYYKCAKGMVITNNYFTEAAIKLAQVNDIILWDRDVLEKKIEIFLN